MYTEKLEEEELYVPDLVKVLSIDGGGVRGIIPAIVLGKLEEKTGKPVAELFDLICGTSTGGLIALALTKGDEQGNPTWTARDLVQFYEEEGREIFPSWRWEKLRLFKKLFGAKHCGRKLRAALLGYLNQTRLKDALTDVLIVSYDIERSVPWVFRSRKAKGSPANYDFPIADVACATCSAPTYFPPMQMAIEEGRNYLALVDGGVVANNPAMHAYVEARAMYPRSDILLVSLGTGDVHQRVPYTGEKGWGLFKWAQPIMKVILDGVSKSVHSHLRQLLREDRYFRFQVELQKGPMDDASPWTIRELTLRAEYLLYHEKNRIEELCALLAAPPGPSTAAKRTEGRSPASIA